MKEEYLYATGCKIEKNSNETMDPFLRQHELRTSQRNNFSNKTFHFGKIMKCRFKHFLTPTVLPQSFADLETSAQSEVPIVGFFACLIVSYC